jgi:hypothetical protein
MFEIPATGGRSRRIMSSRPALAKVSETLSQKQARNGVIPATKKVKLDGS